MGHELTPTLPRKGDLVVVRSRRWLVDDVVPSDSDKTPLVRLACADDDAQGQTLDVLWDYEVDARVIEEEAWKEVASQGFDEPKFFAAFLHTLRWNCVTATDPGLLQSPFRAGIKIDAYQMEPLRKALRLPRVNLFIADDTGLGKTIEAGLIARELLLRKKVKTIVIATPPSVLEQWKAELEERFGLVFEILDRAYLTRMRRERGFGVNPWNTHSRFLISHNLLIDPAYVQTLESWLGDFKDGSLLILDEAHHAAPSSGGKYGIESKFTRAIRDLAPRFEHRLFLSATPHNGHSNSFSTLLELLDPYRFTRGVPVQGKKALDQIMVRRLKEDIRAIQGGFPQRSVVPVVVDGLTENAPELQLSVLLDEYRAIREQRFSGASKRAQVASGLLIVGLQQRLLSSTEAFSRSLKVHRSTAERQRRKEIGLADADRLDPDLFLNAPDADDERGEWDTDELEAEEAAQIESATLTAEGLLSEDLGSNELWLKEQQLLDQMQKIAEDARHHPDAKLNELIDWIRINMCPGLPPFGMKAQGQAPKWNDRRVIIFTENREGTKRYLKSLLEQAIESTDNAEDRIEFAPEDRLALEKLVKELPEAVFKADDSLGWTCPTKFHAKLGPIRGLPPVVKFIHSDTVSMLYSLTSGNLKGCKLATLTLKILARPVTFHGRQKPYRYWVAPAMAPLVLAFAHGETRALWLVPVRFARFTFCFHRRNAQRRFPNPRIGLKHHQQILEMLSQGMTFQQIADYFTAAGVPTPAGSRAWNPAHVYRILKRPMTLGRDHAQFQSVSQEPTLPLFP